MSVHPLPQSFRSWPRRLFFQGVAGLPTAGITGGSHRLARQPPTSLTDDTPNHGAWRLQKIRKYFPATRAHGNAGTRVHGEMGFLCEIHGKGPYRFPDTSHNQPFIDQ
ncbi:SCAR protein [Bifidobacterium longum]|nr:SCAR protein [Bifidobacterium longum]